MSWFDFRNQVVKRHLIPEAEAKNQKPAAQNNKLSF